MSVQVVPANIRMDDGQLSSSQSDSLLVCLVLTNTAGEVKHSFMTFLA